MIPYLIRKLWGTSEERRLKHYKNIVSQINNKAIELEMMSESALRAFITELKENVKSSSLDYIDKWLVDGFAAIKVACEKMRGKEYMVMGHIQEWDMVPYDVQLLGAIAMFKGAVAEQETGEGKTLTATLPLCVHAMLGAPVYLVTINEYLAQRDSEWMAPIYNAMGLKAGFLKSGMNIAEKKEVYKCDVIYTTASELVFDYLREHSVIYSADDVCQKEPIFAVIDEIDAVLIMDARMPLIISGPAEPASPEFKELNPFVALLVKQHEEKCNELVEEAARIFSEHGFFADRALLSNHNVARTEVKEAVRKAWIVSKGWPDHSMIKMFNEYAILKSLIDREEAYFSYEYNHNEKEDVLSAVFLVHNPLVRTFEFTDTGIEAWSEIIPGGNADFVMMDLGDEFGKIDKTEVLSNAEKVERKLEIQREAARRRDRAMCMKQLFYAYIITQKDVTYVVENGEIILLDEIGGRLQYGRRFSHGLHQAIEAKEGLEVQKDTQTYASITLQNFFKMFRKIAGMSGTAHPHAVEFKNVYGLDVIIIPPNLPSQRQDRMDLMFVSHREKMAAIMQDVIQEHNTGRPILLGTSSVEESEEFSKKLSLKSIPHQLLNAKNHKKEAEVISMAGQKYAVTIATNMAGRGTDIKLGVGVAAIGGLHVVVSSRSTSRSIDLQFRGRQGRQGDPGSCQFYVSFEDPLLKMCTTASMRSLLEANRPPEGEGMSSYMLDAAVSSAQERFEFARYQMRKHTLNYDEVVNKQRNEVYSFRDKILKDTDVLCLSEDLLHEFALDFVAGYVSLAGGYVSRVDFKSFRQDLLDTFPIDIEETFFDKHYHSVSMLEEDTSDLLNGEFLKMFNYLSSGYKIFNNKNNNSKDLLRLVLLHSLDSSWKEMLDNLEELRAYVHLRAIGQKDPLVEYRHEAYKMFEVWGAMMRKILAVDSFRFIIEHKATLYGKSDIDSKSLFYVFAK